jgi:2-isopropylmalate synthase
VARFALDQADGTPIDVAFGVSSRVEPEFLAEAASALSEEGIATIKICDSTGELFPLEIQRLYESVLARVPDHVAIGAHLHNDFGLALANNLEAVRLGVRLVSTSWLGLGERNGLAATEQVLFALGYHPEGLSARLGIEKPLWRRPPDLHWLTPIAKMVSQILDLPLKLTDPVVSTHMNHIGTGAYFNNPAAFKPFDPERELGVPPQLYLSHLANHSIVEAIAVDLGYNLDNRQVKEALAWAKTYAYQHGQSTIPEADFAVYLAELTS